MGLFIKKPLEALQAEANQTGSKSLKRVLGPWSLVALGVGVIIGPDFLHNRNSRRRIYRTGHYTFICHCSNRMLLCRTLLCRVCFDDPGCRKCLYILIRDDGRTDRLDYRLGSGTGIYSCRDNGQHQLEPLSRRLLEGLGINLPTAFTACPWDGGIVNIPAFLIVVLMSLFLIRGTEGSSIFNGIIVFLKVSVVLIFVFLGWKYINTDNYIPYIPANTGTLGEYGLSGCPTRSGHRILRFLRFRCCQYGCPGSQEPPKEICRSESSSHCSFVPYYTCCSPTS